MVERIIGSKPHFLTLSVSLAHNPVSLHSLRVGNA